MSAGPLPVLDYPDSELVFGLVYAVGTNDKLISDTLQYHIKKFQYKPNIIRLSDYLKVLITKLNLNIKLDDSSEYARIKSHMDAGDAARDKCKRADLLALRACGEIASERSESTDSKLPEPCPKTAHILFSLKRPEEVIALRRIYGAGFYLIGVFATEQERIEFLNEDKNIPTESAEELIKRDQAEAKDFGQQTRDTFHLADVFIRLKGKEYKKQLRRFVNIVFGHPFETPTADEYAMFLAYAASTRSASFSRQVGAAVTSEEGELVGIGCNDAPCAGGGLYWPGEYDKRDNKFEYHGQTGIDSNEACRGEIIKDIMDRLRSEVQEGQRLANGKEMLKGSPLMDITEYGRSVHAEMEAILSCARAGVSPRKGTLYTTTFPCHNCTRHIVAAGIKRVVYVEPYPKSRARDLHYDSIHLLDEAEPGISMDSSKSDRVNFEPFVGVGPRRFFDLFSLRLSSGYPKKRQTPEGVAKQWKEGEARVQVPMLPTSYLQREKVAAEEVKKIVEETGD